MTQNQLLVFSSKWVSGGAVCWRTKGHPTMILSSFEAENHSWDHFCMKWAISRCRQRLLVKTIRAASYWLPTVMHKKSKHSDTKYHLIREKLDDNSVQLVWTPTDPLEADLVTKSLAKKKVEQHQKRLLGQLQILPPTNEKSECRCWGKELELLELQNSNLSLILAQNRGNKLTCIRKFDVNRFALILWACQKLWTFPNMYQSIGVSNLLDLQ